MKDIRLYFCESHQDIFCNNVAYFIGDRALLGGASYVRASQMLVSTFLFSSAWV